MNKKKAFTLIEIVVVMAIIAVLALMILGAVITARRMSLETKNRNNGKALQVAMERYYSANSQQYPGAGGTFAAMAGTLGITLDTNGLNAGCTASGGGNVTSSATAFTISPSNWNCSAALGDTYVQPN